MGDSLYSGFEHIRDALKYALIPGGIFESFGFKYIGPIDGHEVHELIAVSYTHLDVYKRQHPHLSEEAQR